ncbi:MAG: branched-chain amino acid ABC transporter permease [Clostridia bacterium]|nr:branched-chain amino acid ABC transporter permease [Clostridia bacterium]
MLQQMVNGLMLGSTYALIAIGYSLVFGLLGLVNLAHGEIFMLGGFLGLALGVYLKLPLAVTILGAMLGAGVLGLLLELVCFRPVKRIYFLAPALSSIGFGIIARDVMVNLVGSEPRVFPATVQLPDLHLGPVLVSSVQLLVFGAALLLMVGLSLLINRTELGRAMRTVAENPYWARLLGVNVTRVTMAAFFISSALAGAAGILIGLRIGKISPFIGATVGIKGLAVMVIGGLGNINGAMVGGLLVGMLEVLTSAYLGAVFADVIPWGLLIAVLVFKPSGLFGSKANTDRV